MAELWDLSCHGILLFFMQILMRLLSMLRFDVKNYPEKSASFLYESENVSSVESGSWHQ